MAKEPEKPTPEEQEKIDQGIVERSFLTAAAPYALTPVVVTRFQFMRLGFVSDPVLVVGGGAVSVLMAHGQEEPIARQGIANVVGSFTFNKEFAADLVLHLEREFGIDDAFKAERAKRYTNTLAPKGGADA